MEIGRTTSSFPNFSCSALTTHGFSACHLHHISSQYHPTSGLPLPLLKTMKQRLAMTQKRSTFRAGAFRAEAFRAEAFRAEAIRAAAIRAAAIRLEAIRPEAIRPELIRVQAIKAEAAGSAACEAHCLSGAQGRHGSLHRQCKCSPEA